jgi:hypothetical protein
VHFAAQLTHLTWHPTERLACLPDLAARIQAEGGRNLRPPTVLDVRQPVWPLARVDGMFTANTLHIMSWSEVTCLFQGIGAALAPGGTLCIYGPFRYDGRYTSPSNLEFDRMLQERDPRSRPLRRASDSPLRPTTTCRPSTGCWSSPRSPPEPRPARAELRISTRSPD